MPQQVGVDGSIIVGAKRSMTNPVINRNHFPLGKAVSNNPAVDDSVVYGTLIKRDPESASSLMYSWTAPNHNQKEIDHGRNFLKLNKMAVAAGASDSQLMTQFRQKHDARIVSRPGDVLRLKNQVPVHMEPNKVYGAPTFDPQCNIKSLLHYGYEKEWVNEQLQREKKEKKKEDLRASLRATASSTRHPPADKKDTAVEFSLPSIKTR